MVEKPNKFQPALVGGLIIGVLSSIPLVSVCCCLWVLLGSAISAWMLIRRSPVLPVTTGEGATVGALAGVVGSLITLVITVPLNILMSEANIESMRRTAEGIGNSAGMEPVIALMERSPLLFALMVWFFSAIIIIGLATLGGVIGVALFEKRKGQSPPPPPAGPMGYPPQGPPPGYAPPSPPPGGPQSPY